MADVLAGKAAFITGGAQGIGLAVARAFVREGALVTIADVAPEPLATALDALDAAGQGRVRAVRLDVTDEHGTEQAANEATDAHGRVDIVVPNAGVLILKPAVDTTLAEWRRVIDVNLTGAFLTARAFARRMSEGDAGGASSLPRRCSGYAATSRTAPTRPPGSG